ncbi:WG repeat-containing protein [Ginsengibacter hankyongi]|uniref:WG repeat-containing protein n=1 Tax=Ginsengibacter hankyongi TaxID=2607284 RepID=A0A5J5ICK0_9BACT|nr:WG repeat-containing protein [Ginsengibacter hankyongi]KAA9037185.1 WG repeat-containing protein [Ginsengibacter hankyongi]
MRKLLLLVLLFPVIESYAQNWEKNYDYVDDCVCGLSQVKKNGKVGYVNKKGIEIIKPQYDDGLPFNEGYTAVKKGTKWMYLDSTGKVVTDAVFEEALNFSNGMAAVAQNGKYGYINTSGKVVIPFEFSNAHPFSEGLAPAANMKGLWGYIDNAGTWIINPMYDYTDSFINGEARVMKDSKVFYVDKKNTMLHE